MLRFLNKTTMQQTQRYRLWGGKPLIEIVFKNSTWWSMASSVIPSDSAESMLLYTLFGRLIRPATASLMRSTSSFVVARMTLPLAYSWSSRWEFKSPYILSMRLSLLSPFDRFQCSWSSTCKKELHESCHRTPGKKMRKRRRKAWKTYQKRTLDRDLLIFLEKINFLPPKRHKC